MTFESWLKKQRKRNDAVGDLARDFYDAKRLYNCKNREKCNEEHLLKFNACENAFGALIEARKEYDKIEID